MRSCVRFSFLALLVGVLVAVAAPAAQAAVPFGIETFVAVNCSVGYELARRKTGTRADAQILPEGKKPSLAESEAQGYTQAGGHVPFGITDFKITHHGRTFPNRSGRRIVTHIRTDVALGPCHEPGGGAAMLGRRFRG